MNSSFSSEYPPEVPLAISPYLDFIDGTDPTRLAFTLRKDNDPYDPYTLPWSKLSLNAGRSLHLGPSRSSWEAAYTDKEVADRLAMPSGYTHDNIFTEGAADSRNADATERWLMQEERRSTADRYALSGLAFLFSPNRLTFGEQEIHDGQKLYSGPYYLQGQEGTCNAWATVHGLLVIGVEPTVLVVKDLLNRAVSGDALQKKGMSAFASAATLEESGIGVSNTLFMHFDSDITPPNVGAYIQHNLDQGSAVIASVKRGDDRHAICIAGYKSTGGRMQVQCIDSGRGEYVLSVERLVEELALDSMHPALRVISRKSA